MAVEGRKQHVRMDPKERKGQLLAAGVALAQKYGASNVTRRMIAEKTKTTDGLVSRYFGSVSKLAKAITTEAAKRKVTLVTDPAKLDALRKRLWDSTHPNASHRAKPETKASKPKSAGKKTAAKKPAKKAATKKKTTARAAVAKATTASKPNPKAPGRVVKKARAAKPSPAKTEKAISEAVAATHKASKGKTKPKSRTDVDRAAVGMPPIPAPPPLPPLPG